MTFKQSKTKFNYKKDKRNLAPSIDSIEHHQKALLPFLTDYTFDIMPKMFYFSAVKYNLNA